MGFMGLADGGRIKVAVNCKSSAEFMREEGKKTMQICQNSRGFLFQVFCCTENTIDSLCELWGCWIFFVCVGTKNAPLELHKRSDFIQLAGEQKL